MSNASGTTRNVGIDSLRGWLIILVMLGHIVLGSVHDNIIRYSIYAFHMPVFIGLTGYLINADTLRKNSFSQTLMRYWWRVLFPFAFAFAFFTSILAFHALQEGRLGVSLLASYFHTPYYHLWFVPTLVLWVIAFSLVLKARISIKWMLLLFALLSLLWATFDLDQQWAYLAPLLSKKVIYFFSFFLFGAWLRTSNSKKFRAVFTQFKVLPIAVIVACGGLYLLQLGADKSFFKALLWSALNITLITVLIDSAIANSKRKPTIISELGRNSLPIYLWHVVPLFLLKGFDVHQTQVLIYYFASILSMALIVFTILRVEGRNQWVDKCLYGTV